VPSRTALRIAHVRVESQITGEAWEAMYALLYFGGHDVTCALRPGGRAAYDRMKEERCGASHHRRRHGARPDEFFRASRFPAPSFDERRRAGHRLGVDKHEETYRGSGKGILKLVRYLRQVDTPIPEALAIVARHVLERGRCRWRVDGGALPERATELVRETRTLGTGADSPRQPCCSAPAGRLDAVAGAGPERVTAAAWSRTPRFGPRAGL
jgi:hypothetical protein